MYLLANSNLKNNYQPVKLWDYNTERFAKTGLQFCGLIMGDHSKSGINTMFNTGTVVGVAANVFGADYPRNFIPSYSWGITRNITFRMKRVLEMAEAMMGWRKRLGRDKKVHFQNFLKIMSKSFRYKRS